MARTFLLEPVQGRQFQVFDIPNFEDYDVEESILPVRLGAVTLAFGFTQVTAPELILEAQPIEQGLVIPPIDIITGVTVGSITLSRGVYIIDPEFYDWIRMAERGVTYSGVFRRNLLLVWFHDRLTLGSFTYVPGFAPSVGGGPPVPFRAILLKDVIPIRYKTATDFDASASEISLQELELKPRDFENIDVGQLIFDNLL